METRALLRCSSSRRSLSCSWSARSFFLRAKSRMLLSQASLRERKLARIWDWMLSCRACRLDAEGGLAELEACLSISASMDRVGGTSSDDCEVWR